ncbi:MAG TPA: pyridoxal-dependent decarboxylase [Pyrinomonadaceae bacterium]|nr:pyridoxal-dependent decarboxylase [Pyrinomonadaceae bacterium]
MSKNSKSKKSASKKGDASSPSKKGSASSPGKKGQTSAKGASKSVERRNAKTTTTQGVAPPISPPTGDSCSVYPTVPGITCSKFQLPPTGMSATQRADALAELERYLSGQKANFLGYQANQALRYEELKRYLDYHVNNIGDPFQSGNFTVNSKWMERAVLDYYAALWNARWPYNPKDPESYWGYVLTMGSTEGNLYGMWNGRDYLAGKFLLEDQSAAAEAQAASADGGEPQSVPRRLLYVQAPTPEDNPNAFTPVAFYSDDTHYSIIKNGIILGIQTFYELGTALYPNQNPLAPGQPWPKEVPSQGGNAGPGSIDVKALATLVEFFASRGYPILVIFNYGTTFKGAYDDVEAAGKALMPILKKYGLDERKVYYDPNNPSKFDVRTGYWFHVDGALGSAYMPFIEIAYREGRIKQRGPNFDFRLPFVHSLVMSGHKWIGAPWPCGVFMTKVKYQLAPPDDPEYIGAPDTTFAGSRNGFSAMILWDYLARTSYGGEIRKAIYTEEMADYAHFRLKELENKLKQDLWVSRSPLSLTIRFKKANPDIIFKYSLSGETLYVNGQQRGYNHIFMMEHVTRERIDSLIKDLSQPDAFPVQKVTSTTADEKDIARGARELVHFPHIGRGFK